ncbi:MAG: RNA 2',3'-cyclic phosphodiesterase [Paludisphaera borealis]|uniref:RNA 2',3'-cyclic phosphodiesterase n=1 Tax=Paludisphaera borealis TaxID=1387353 RepID=UPI002846D074|nr:RNA 2',3'-cyclic phosphodiesterase [Paludisphaera borealis]MDR3620597.1 RNA 2',3'-cyclic phosphodiesterase [Paludisphaera borealis]
MAQTTRTFIAIPLTDSLGDRLTKLQGRLAPQLPSVRWSETLPFHLTLAFLGDVPYVDLNKICGAVAKASRTVRRFELTITGLGAFPNLARPRVLWAKVEGEGLALLADLHKAVGAALEEVGCIPEDERFSPHITLGRIKPGRSAAQPNSLGAVVARHQTWSLGGFSVGEVVTFSSTVTPEGPAYAPLARAPLASARTRTDDLTE